MCRSKIKLIGRKRQSGATRELCAKFFGDENSILIVANNDIYENALVSHFQSPEKYRDRVTYKGSVNYKELIKKYKKWYVDVIPENNLLDLVSIAIKRKDITLYGYLELKEES